MKKIAVQIAILLLMMIINFYFLQHIITSDKRVTEPLQRVPRIQNREITLVDHDRGGVGFNAVLGTEVDLINNLDASVLVYRDGVITHADEGNDFMVNFQYGEDPLIVSPDSVEWSLDVTPEVGKGYVAELFGGVASENGYIYAAFKVLECSEDQVRIVYSIY